MKRNEVVVTAVVFAALAVVGVAAGHPLMHPELTSAQATALAGYQEEVAQLNRQPAGSLTQEQFWDRMAEEMEDIHKEGGCPMHGRAA